MAQQGVQPNLLTFNALLKTLRKCGGVGRSMSLLVIKEMEALNIGKRTRVVVALQGHLRSSQLGVEKQTTIVSPS